VDECILVKAEAKMTQEAWQLGYDIEVLREYARVFKERHKPLVYGAFGLV